MIASLFIYIIAFTLCYLSSYGELSSKFKRLSMQYESLSMLSTDDVSEESNVDNEDVTLL